MNSTDLPGVALITGAGSTGIGSAVAHAFVKAGCTKLILTDISEASLEVCQLSLKALPAATTTDLTIHTVAGDITDPAFVEEFFIKAKGLFGRIDYAVNCAGVRNIDKTSTETPIEEFDRINAVNYRGLWLCSRAELDIMAKQDLMMDGIPGLPESRRQRGAIVNIASTLALVGRQAGPIYCATKGAVMSLTRCDAIDYAKYNIRVNAVCPGLIETPMTLPRKEFLKPATDIAPMKRMGLPEEVAEVCVFLASERASFVQGAGWVVDGGYTIN